MPKQRLIVSFVAIVLVGVGAAVLLKGSGVPAEVAEAREYHDQDGHYSLMVPADWTVRENDTEFQADVFVSADGRAQAFVGIFQNPVLATAAGWGQLKEAVHAQYANNPEYKIAHFEERRWKSHEAFHMSGSFGEEGGWNFMQHGAKVGDQKVVTLVMRTQKNAGETYQVILEAIEASLVLN